MRKVGLLLGVLWAAATLARADSLPALVGGQAPRTLDELWAGYDPAAEPLDAQVVREWQDADGTYRLISFTIGTFKGRPSRMTALYGSLRRDRKLPAILRLHGSGDSASLPLVATDVNYGYASLALNWLGNPPSWGRTGDPNTDWGALDLSPQHFDHFASWEPDARTVDSVVSPRNSNWFVAVLAARRALTWLAQQPEVDPARLGVAGHSLGATLAVELAAIDPRVKAVVPSSGAIGQTDGGGELKPYLARLNVPTCYLGSTNDPNAPVQLLFSNWASVPSPLVRYSIAPHLAHMLDVDTYVNLYLWLDQHLKGASGLPASPKLQVKLDTADHIPVAEVALGDARLPADAAVLYTVDAHADTRFWRQAFAQRTPTGWSARLPVTSTTQPLAVLANVKYDVREPYQKTQKLKHSVVTAPLVAFTPEQLQAAGVLATDPPSALIDDGSHDWRDWYRLNWDKLDRWAAMTRKVKDPKYAPPDMARLAIDIKTNRVGVLMIYVSINTRGAYPGRPAGNYAMPKLVFASDKWQTVYCGLADLKPLGEAGPLTSWANITEVGYGAAGSNKPWHGGREFRNLRWEQPR